mmetsp:Transcript_27436/g.47621  ORF Transcript_27436/g.47621 Transcript_27436/m.47621 type:complete len:232 (-) Transcript_27436:109-804(-)
MIIEVGLDIWSPSFAPGVEVALTPKTSSSTALNARASARVCGNSFLRNLLRATSFQGVSHLLLRWSILHCFSSTGSSGILCHFGLFFFVLKSGSGARSNNLSAIWFCLSVRASSSPHNSSMSSTARSPSSSLDSKIGMYRSSNFTASLPLAASRFTSAMLPISFSISAFIHSSSSSYCVLSSCSSLSHTVLSFFASSRIAFLSFALSLSRATIALMCASPAFRLCSCSSLL